jgi:hypothetical protein
LDQGVSIVRFPSIKFLLALGVAIVAGHAAADAGAEVAMVTSLQGRINRVAPLGPQAVEAFTKLKHGDLLALDKGAMLQLVYFENGRQETWRGPGKLEIAKTDSTPKGLKPPEVKTLPPVMVKQIAKTPVLESQGRAGMMRLRGVASAEDIATVESTYRRMRQEATAKDINPDLYLLSAMFELREFDRIEKALADLQREQPGNPDVPMVATIYTKAVQNAREAK